MVGDLIAVAKSIILKEHATNTNNLHELLAEPKIDKHINYHISNQSKQEAIGLLKNIFKTTYNQISSQQEEASYEPLKTRIESSAF